MIRRQLRSHDTPIWLIIFSDLSTNLMLFFLMLFALTRMSAPERELLLKGVERAMRPAQKVETISETLRREDLAIITISDAIAYSRLNRYAQMEISDDKIKLTLTVPFFFETGSAELSPEAREALMPLVSPLKQIKREVIVEGHTDNVPVSGGLYPSNWELSVARAVRVIEFFGEHGVAPERLVAGGYGEFHPAFPNDTEENRARNRRIEITIPREER